jgi:hypothetical protein
MAHIADRNLRLLLLQAAWNENLIPRFDKVAFFRDQLHEELTDDAECNYRIDTRVLDALLAIPLTDETLAKIRFVEMDAGNEIYRDIWSYWGGVSDEFDIRDLSGIEACTSLESLIFISKARFKDISPLASLPSLIEFKDFSEPIADLRPLLSVPKLRVLDVHYEPTKENRAVIAALKLRGVSVVEH